MSSESSARARSSDCRRAHQPRGQFARFEAGARNLPHTHSFDQAPLITEGEGVLAIDDEQHRVTARDFVLVPAGERHWHGATDSSSMSHLALGVPGSSDFDGVAYGVTAPAHHQLHELDCGTMTMPRQFIFGMQGTEPSGCGTPIGQRQRAMSMPRS